MTRCSLNEVEGYTRRAARGAGLSWGLAEEAGKAARWLAARELPGVTLIDALLEHNDGRPYAALKPMIAGDTWRAAGGELCPVCTGAALSDRGAAVLAGGALTLERTLCPLLLAPFVARLAATGAGALVLAFDGLRLQLADDTAILASGDPAALSLTVSDAVRIEVAEAAARPGTVGAGPVDVEDAVWRRLAALAHRTYVPASEASRTRGAGAGTSDND